MGDWTNGQTDRLGRVLNSNGGWAVEMAQEGEGVCRQARKAEFDPQDLHSRKKEPLSGSPVSQTCTAAHVPPPSFLILLHTKPINVEKELDWTHAAVHCNYLPLAFLSF